MTVTIKNRIYALVCALALVSVLPFYAPSLKAGEFKFTELKKKLTYDTTPLDRKMAVTSYADILEGAMPAVVTVASSKQVETTSGTHPFFNDPFFKRFFPEGQMPNTPPHREEGLGSGVVISPDGYILTNNHVVEGADEIKVTFSSSKRDFDAKVIGTDPQTDVALIKIEATGLSAITIGDSAQLRVGDVTMAVGNPFGLDQTVTMGIVSALGRSHLDITGGGYENFIQTDAAINRGNSGGALIDAQGRLIGINTAIQSGYSGGNIGIGFAIPVNMALNIVERLLDNDGTVRRGFLGVFLRELDADLATALGREDKSGVLITDVGKGTPADKAGLKAGDLIVGYDGKEVSDMPKLRLDISNTSPGTEVAFDVVRSDKKTKVDVTLGDLGDAAALSMAPGTEAPEAPGVAPEEEEFVTGVEIAEIDETARTAFEIGEDVKGVIVKSVDPSSKAAESGLVAGQVVTQVNQKEVASVDEALAARKAFSGDVLLLQVYAAGRRDILAVRVTGSGEKTTDAPKSTKKDEKKDEKKGSE